MKLALSLGQFGGLFNAGSVERRVAGNVGGFPADEVVLRGGEKVRPTKMKIQHVVCRNLVVFNANENNLPFRIILT